jgi:predicted ribosome quality control (RQC) complex YloA/Tae2 family protein
MAEVTKPIMLNETGKEIADALNEIKNNVQYFKGEKGDTGEKGSTGNGIKTIEKTATNGLIDTYTITYTDGTTSTFEITNGEDGEVTEEQLNKIIAEQNQVIERQAKRISGLEKDLEENTVEGESITVNDSAETSASIEVKGNSYQETGDVTDDEENVIGTMPSPDYPSEILSCGDNGSINEVITTGILPKEYQQVEYIESTGTQYIDTGLKPNAETIFNITFQLTSVAQPSYAVLFGAQNTSYGFPRYSSVCDKYV